METAWLIKGMPGILLVWNAWNDYRKREIEPISLWIFTGIGIVLNLKYSYQSPQNMIGGILVGGFMLLTAFFSRGAVGEGDGWLLCVMGIYLGMAETLALLLGALFLCAVCSAVLLVIKRADGKTGIPFVPFLLAAYMGELLL